MTRRRILQTGLGWGAAAPLVRAQRNRRSPNILLIVTDDQGYGDLSVTGNRHLSTPNIDAIAR